MSESPPDSGYDLIGRLLGYRYLFQQDGEGFYRVQSIDVASRPGFFLKDKPVWACDSSEEYRVQLPKKDTT